MRFRACSFLVVSLFTSTASQVQAVIVSHSPSVSVIPAPQSVRDGTFENSSVIYAFVEQGGEMFSNYGDLMLDISMPGTYPGPVGEDQNAGTISANSSLHSYYIHFDKVGSDDVVKTITGFVNFNEEVKGIVFRSIAFNNPCCLTDYPYLTIYQPGLELESGQDVITLSQDRHAVTFTLRTSLQDADNFRIYTSAGGTSSTSPSVDHPPRVEVPGHNQCDGDHPPADCGGLGTPSTIPVSGTCGMGSAAFLPLLLTLVGTKRLLRSRGNQR